MPSTACATNRPTRCLAWIATGLVAVALIASPAEAQRISFAGGTGARAVVAQNVGMEMPVLMQFRAEGEAAPTAQAERHTEYTLRYTVRTNTNWEVAVVNVPQGVSVLSADGWWSEVGGTSPVAVLRGVPTNGTEVVIRVLVADGADLGWQDALKVEARRR